MNSHEPSLPVSLPEPRVQDTLSSLLSSKQIQEGYLGGNKGLWLVSPLELSGVAYTGVIVLHILSAVDREIPPIMLSKDDLERLHFDESLFHEKNESFAFDRNL